MLLCPTIDCECFAEMLYIVTFCKHIVTKVILVPCTVN